MRAATKELSERWHRHLIGILAATAGVTVLSLALGLVVPSSRLGATGTNFSLLYLLVVVPVAVRFGSLSAVVAVFLAIGVYDWFFLEPLYTFAIRDPAKWIELPAFLAVALAAVRTSVHLWRNVIGIMVAVAGVAAISLVVGFGRALIPTGNFSPLYLIVVLAVSYRFGGLAAIVAAVFSLAAYDWLFVAPIHTLDVSDPAEWVELAVFLLVVVVVDRLVIRQASEMRARQASELRAQHLQQQVEAMRIEIDRTRQAKEVDAIVHSDYFAQLQQRARYFRQRREGAAGDLALENGPPR